MGRLRWGIIGCGDVARKRVAAAILQDPHSELMAACRRSPAALEQFCQDFGIADEKAFTDAAALIDDPDVDAVYIASPVREHLPQTLAAAAAGKHVLVEKPMARDGRECQAMLEACQRADVRLGVAYYRRFYPMVERLEQLIGSGQLGTVLGASAITATPLDMAPGEEGAWRMQSEAAGGGALMDVGSHRINVLTHLLGDVTEVKAICETVAASYDTEDAAVVVMRFQSGAVATVQCHFGSEDPDRLEIIGTKGRVIAEPLNGDRLVVELGGGRQSEHLPPAENLCAPLIADFVAAVRQGRPPRVDGQEGWAANEVMEAAYRSAGRSNHLG